MTAAFTITAACVGCGNCLLTCPVHAIRPAGRGHAHGPSAEAGSSPDGEGPAGGGADQGGGADGAGRAAPLVVLDHCTGCGECGEVCPADACVPLPGTGGAL